MQNWGVVCRASDAQTGFQLHKQSHLTISTYRALLCIHDYIILLPRATTTITLAPDVICDYTLTFHLYLLLILVSQITTKTPAAGITKETAS